jgi:hypothetical protein
MNSNFRKGLPNKKLMILYVEILTAYLITTIFKTTPFSSLTIRTSMKSRRVNSKLVSGSKESIYPKTCFNQSFISPAFGEILGSGAFGIVYKGIVHGVPAAVKTVKADGGKESLKALLSEIKIIMYIGKHEHIVQLLAANTSDLQKGTWGQRLRLKLYAIITLEN